MNFLKWALMVCVACAVYSMPAEAQAGGTSYSAVLDPKNSFGFFVVKGATPLFQIHMGEWGDKNAWNPGPHSTDIFKDGKLTTTSDAVFDKTGHLLHSLEMSVSPEKNLLWKAELTAKDSDVAVTQVAFICGLLGAADGKITLVSADGTPTVLPVPLQEGTYPAISRIDIEIPGSDKVELNLGAPFTVMAHGKEIYVCVAGHGWNHDAEVIASGGKKDFSFNFTFPDKITLASSDAFVKPMADASWFIYNATDWTSPSVIGMEDWIEKPAGKHGGVRSVGDHFQFEDGTPVKFWGTGITYSSLAPTQDNAKITAAFLAHMGCNTMRCAIFGNPGWRGIGAEDDATQFDPKKLDQFDYFMSQLASQGIYYRFSPNWSVKILPKNKDQVLNYDEITRMVDSVSQKPGEGTTCLANFAEDIQDIMIQKVVNLLKHQNPYTNKTYAQDPALCSIEMQNEDDIFWYGTVSAFKACPTYAKKLAERYNEWLKQRYSSQDALKTAWIGALKDGESLETGNISIDVSPYNFTLGDKLVGGARQRMLDNALFLHVVQDSFYAKFAKAIRDAGYQGPIYGSNWQAAEMLPHYYNLKSDAAVGLIDRHNYFGKNIFDSMLAQPGSGILSAGLQQVADRPFGLSEWISVYPDCYGAEGPPLMAAYGMGLLGWNSSYEFQSHVAQQPPPSSARGFGLATTTLMNTMVGTPPYGVWEADTPTQIGQYPLLARMIYRGDLKQGDVISVRKISESELEQSTFSFTDNYKQTGDIKDFSGGSVPPAALAAGRCLVQFTDAKEASVLPDMTKYMSGTVITSTTGQLKWDSADKGFITINSDGTKAVVGFAPGKAQVLGNVTITSQSPFASIILTAADKASTLEKGSSAILSAVARQSNTGFTYSLLDETVINNGDAPILLEPVQADIAIKGRTIEKVNVLNQNGTRGDKTLPVTNGTFHIDTGKEQTIYYEVVFKP